MAHQPIGTADPAPSQHHESSHPASSTVGGNDIEHADSAMSQSHTLTPSRGGTLKKRQSLSKRNSVKRSGSKKASRPGSMRSLTFGDDVDGQKSEMQNAFFTPVPTNGNPTEILANRFQVWRKVLKDLITYFREVQKSYEHRSKSLYTLSNVISNITAPIQFITHGGVSDALNILRDYHKQSITEGNKAKSIEDDVIVQLTGLRSDLGQKIKEIKGLSGDFKNNVDKETEATRRAVRDLQDTLYSSNSDPKGDPYLVRLGVERQLARQIEEENYLHRAFLNLENSGRELESIVMGEIQKAYNAYAGIIKREADEASDTAEKLRSGPLAIPRDFEWNAFVDNNEHFIDPRLPVRRVENITYAGKDDAAASEVKGGMLERKSKYLKSYTPGWYVLSATHLHEFKSPDRIASQAPIMSLALADQKLGSHSNADSTSHKFMLKGRQNRGMHRGHAWVFRAETYDTMMAWFSDIRNLTEKTGAERNAFIQRSHARSLSNGSHRRSSVSSDGLEEDEADQVPYSATPSQADIATQQEKQSERPNPGGRFYSALSVDPGSHVPLSPSSNQSCGDQEAVADASVLHRSGIPLENPVHLVQSGGDEINSARGEFEESSQKPSYSDGYPLYQQDPQSSSLHNDAGPISNKSIAFETSSSQARENMSSGADSGRQPIKGSFPFSVERHNSKYGDWMGPAFAVRTSGETINATSVEADAVQQNRRSVAIHEGQSGLQSFEPQIPTSSTTMAKKPEAHLEGDISTPAPLCADTSKVATVRTDHIAPDLRNETISRRENPAKPIKDLAEPAERPVLATQISDLHFPGEFPKGRS